MSIIKTSISPKFRIFGPTFVLYPSMIAFNSLSNALFKGFSLLCLFLLTLSTSAQIKEVEQKFENGKPKVVAHYLSAKGPENLTKRETFDDAGTKIREENYFKGKLHGKVLEWKPFDGTKIAELNYLEGKMEGEQKWFNADGSAKMTLTYANGRMDGPQKAWYFPGGANKTDLNYSAGILHGIQREWNPDGSPKYNLNFVAGKPEGILRWYDANGKLTEETWHQGALEEQAENYGTGKPKTVKHYTGVVKGDSMNVVLEKVLEKVLTYSETASIESITMMGASPSYKSFYPSGKVRREGKGTLDKPEGLWTEMHENGQKKSEGEYSNGAKSGIHSTWDVNGQLVAEEQFVNGTRKEWKVFTWHSKGLKFSEGKVDEKGRKIGSWLYWHPTAGVKMREEEWVSTCAGSNRPVMKKFTEWDANGKVVSEGTEKAWRKYVYQTSGVKGEETAYEMPGWPDCTDKAFLYEAGGKMLSNLGVEGETVKDMLETKKVVTEHITYRIDGQPRLIERWNTAGKLHGAQESWTPDGKQVYVYTYNDGLPEGAVKEWYAATNTPMLDLMYVIGVDGHLSEIDRGTFYTDNGKDLVYSKAEDKALSKRQQEIYDLSGWKKFREGH